MKEIIIKNLGKIDYLDAWRLQEKFFQETIQIKKDNVKKNINNITNNYLLACEHNHVYTVGKSFSKQYLLSLSDILYFKNNPFNDESFTSNKAENSLKVPCYFINRGGNITYHGPGQLILYPILNLESFVKDIDKYLRMLENSVIECLKYYGIDAIKIDGMTGIWIKNKELYKICSIGIRANHWTVMHGLALNINTDLNYFDVINPCGLEQIKATSMKQILNSKKDLNKEKILGVLLSILKDNIVKHSP